jgi:hypothetical protein
VDFKDYVVGKSTPSKDNINTALLQDVQTAAKMAGLNVDITTAISGHDVGTRHETGNAVDVAKINGIGSGGATNETNGNAEFRKLGNKLKDALVSMGYVWNTEIGNTKSVLWQTNKGGNHFNHVHISNNSGETSEKSTKNTDTSKPSSETTPNVSSTTSISSSGEITKPDPLIMGWGKALTDFFGLEENINRIKGLLK